MQQPSIPTLKVPNTYPKGVRPIEVPLPVGFGVRNEKTIPRVLTDPLFNLRVREYYRDESRRNIGTELIGRATGTAIGAAKGRYTGKLLGALIGLGSWAVSLAVPGDFGTIGVAGTASASALAGAKVGGTIGTAIGATAGFLTSDYTTALSMGELLSNNAKAYAKSPAIAILGSLSTLGRTMDLIGGGEVIRAAIYAGVKRQNLFKTIAEAYGLSYDGRTEVETEVIRKELGIDIGRLGNTVIDVVGDIFTDPGFVSSIATSGFSKITKTSRENINTVLKEADITNSTFQHMISDEKTLKQMSKAILENDESTIVKLFSETAVRNADDISDVSMEVIRKTMKEVREKASINTANTMYDLLKEIDSLDDFITARISDITVLPFSALKYAFRGIKLIKGIPTSGILGKLNYFFFGNKANWNYTTKLSKEYDNLINQRITSDLRMYTNSSEEIVNDSGLTYKKYYIDLKENNVEFIEADKKIITNRMNTILEEMQGITTNLEKNGENIDPNIKNLAKLTNEYKTLQRLLLYTDNPELFRLNRIMTNLRETISRVSKIRKMFSSKYSIPDVTLRKIFDQNITELISILRDHPELAEYLDADVYNELFKYIKNTLTDESKKALLDIFNKNIDEGNEKILGNRQQIESVEKQLTDTVDENSKLKERIKQLENENKKLKNKDSKTTRTKRSINTKTINKLKKQIETNNETIEDITPSIKSEIQPIIDENVKIYQRINHSYLLSKKLDINIIRPEIDGTTIKKPVEYIDQVLMNKNRDAVDVLYENYLNTGNFKTYLSKEEFSNKIFSLRKQIKDTEERVKLEQLPNNKLVNKLQEELIPYVFSTIHELEPTYINKIAYDSSNVGYRREFAEAWNRVVNQVNEQKYSTPIEVIQDIQLLSNAFVYSTHEEAVLNKISEGLDKDLDNILESIGTDTLAIDENTYAKVEEIFIKHDVDEESKLFEKTKETQTQNINVTKQITNLVEQKTSLKNNITRTRKELSNIKKDKLDSEKRLNKASQEKETISKQIKQVEEQIVLDKYFIEKHRSEIQKANKLKENARRITALENYKKVSQRLKDTKLNLKEKYHKLESFNNAVDNLENMIIERTKQESKKYTELQTLISKDNVLSKQIKSLNIKKSQLDKTLSSFNSEIQLRYYTFKNIKDNFIKFCEKYGIYINDYSLTAPQQTAIALRIAYLTRLDNNLLYYLKQTATSNDLQALYSRANYYIGMSKTIPMEYVQLQIRLDGTKKILLSHRGKMTDPISRAYEYSSSVIIEKINEITKAIQEKQIILLDKKVSKISSSTNSEYLKNLIEQIKQKENEIKNTTSKYALIPKQAELDKLKKLYEKEKINIKSNNITSIKNDTKVQKSVKELNNLLKVNSTYMYMNSVVKRLDTLATENQMNIQVIKQRISIAEKNRKTIAESSLPIDEKSAKLKAIGTQLVELNNELNRLMTNTDVTAYTLSSFKEQFSKIYEKYPELLNIDIEDIVMDYMYKTMFPKNPEEMQRLIKQTQLDENGEEIISYVDDLVGSTYTAYRTILPVLNIIKDNNIYTRRIFDNFIDAISKMQKLTGEVDYQKVLDVQQQILDNFKPLLEQYEMYRFLKNKFRIDMSTMDLPIYKINIKGFSFEKTLDKYLKNIKYQQDFFVYSDFYDIVRRESNLSADELARLGLPYSPKIISSHLQDRTLVYGEHSLFKKIEYAPKNRVLIKSKLNGISNEPRYFVTFDTETSGTGPSGLLLQLSVKVVDIRDTNNVITQTFYIDPDDYELLTGANSTKYKIDPKAIDVNKLTVDEIRKRKNQAFSENNKFITHQDLKLIFSEKGQDTAISYMFRDDSVVFAHNAKFDFSVLANNFDLPIDQFPANIFDDAGEISRDFSLDNYSDFFDMNVIDTFYLAKKFNVFYTNSFSNEALIKAFAQRGNMPYLVTKDSDNILKHGITMLITDQGNELFYNGKSFHDADIDIDVTSTWAIPTFITAAKKAKELGQPLNVVLNGDIDLNFKTINLFENKTEKTIQTIENTKYVNEEGYGLSEEAQVKINEVDKEIEQLNQRKEYILRSKYNEYFESKVNEEYERLLADRDKEIYGKKYYEQALENVINNTEYYFDEDIKKIQNDITEALSRKRKLLEDYLDKKPVTTVEVKNIEQETKLYKFYKEILEFLGIDGDQLSISELIQLDELLNDDFRLNREYIAPKLGLKDDEWMELYESGKETEYVPKAKAIHKNIDDLKDVVSNYRRNINNNINNFLAITKRYNNIGFFGKNRNFVRAMVLENIYYDEDFSKLFYILSGNTNVFAKDTNDYTLASVFNILLKNADKYPELQNAIDFIRYTRDSIEWEYNLIQEFGTYNNRQLDLFYQCLGKAQELKVNGVTNENDLYIELASYVAGLMGKRDVFPNDILNKIVKRMVENDSPLFMLDAAENFSNQLYKIVYINLLNPLSDIINNTKGNVVNMDSYFYIRDMLSQVLETNRNLLKSVKEYNRINKWNLGMIDIDDFVATTGMTPFDLIRNNYEDTIRFNKITSADQSNKTLLNNIIGHLYNEDSTFNPTGRNTFAETVIGNVVTLMADTLGIPVNDLLRNYQDTDFKLFSSFYEFSFEDLLSDINDPLNRRFQLIYSSIYNLTKEKLPYINNVDELQDILKKMFMDNFIRNKVMDYVPGVNSESIIRLLGLGKYTESFIDSHKLFNNIKSIFYKNNENFDEAAISFRNFFRDRKDLVLVYVDEGNNKILKIKTSDLQSLKNVLMDKNTVFSIMSNAEYIAMANKIQPIVLPKWLQSIHKYLILPSKLFSLTYSIPFLVTNAVSAYIQNVTSNGFHPIKAFQTLTQTAKEYHKWKELYQLATSNLYLWDKYQDLTKVEANWLDYVKTRDIDFINALRKEDAERFAPLIEFLENSSDEELKAFINITEMSNSVASYTEIIDIQRNRVIGEQKKKKYEQLRSSDKLEDQQEFWVINDNPNDGFETLQDELNYLDKVIKEKLEFNQGPIENLYRRRNILRDKINNKFNKYFTAIQKYTGMKWWLDINNDIEIIFRMSMMKESMEVGEEFSQAAQDVIDRHFIYNDKSVAERMAEIVIPFISYPLKAAKLFSDLTEDAEFVKLMYIWNKYSWGDEDTEQSEYLSRRKAKGDIPIGNQLVGIGNSFTESLLSLADPLNTINNKINPIARPLIDVAKDSEYNRWTHLLGPFSGIVEGIQEQTFNPGVLTNMSRKYENYNNGLYYRAYPQRSTFYKNLYTQGGYSRISMNMQQATMNNLRYRVGNIIYNNKYRHR